MAGADIHTNFQLRVRTLFKSLRTNGLARSAFTMIFIRGLSIFIGVSLSVLLARWLAPDGYGAYLFTVTIAQFLAMPILAGLPTLVVREVAFAQAKGDAARRAGIIRWSAGFVLLTFVAVAACAAIVFILLDKSQDTASIQFLALPLVLALACLRLASAVVQGHEHPVAGSLGDGLIRPALLLSLVLIFAFSGLLSPATALWLHVVSAAMLAGFAV